MAGRYDIELLQRDNAVKDDSLSQVAYRPQIFIGACVI
jgi:hypothetical protein